MEIIARISKGTKMDQIYLPKIRSNLPAGSYVLVKLLEETLIKDAFKPYFYNTKEIEPIKIEIIKSIFETIGQAENILITGSFLERGFYFNDIDILILTEKPLNEEKMKEELESRIKIKTHVIAINSKSLQKGLSTDPLYQAMLSKFISKKRIIFNIEKEINYRLLDLHLLNSKTLLDNFEILNGNEKYNLTRNLIAITMFIKNKKITNETINQEIEKIFNIKIENIRQNMLNKNFLKKYRGLYSKVSKKVIENASKQK